MKSGKININCLMFIVLEPKRSERICSRVGTTGGLGKSLFPTSSLAQYIAVTMIGGAVSEAAGGDFLEGAIAAAMVHLFNDMQAKAEAEAAEYRATGIYMMAFQLDPNDPNSWYVIDPNASSLINSLGSNAENWYNRDAPIAKNVFNGLMFALPFGGKIFYEIKALGYTSSTAWTGGLVGGGIGFGIGCTSSLGLNSQSPKDFINSNKDAYIDGIIREKLPSIYRY